MRPPPPLGPSFFARWTSRIAVFSAVLLATAIFLHRLFSLPTPIAENLTRRRFPRRRPVAGDVRRRDGRHLAHRATRHGARGVRHSRQPRADAVAADLPAEIRRAAEHQRRDDRHDESAAVRRDRQAARAGANPVDYPGPAFARKQLAAYPDIKPIEIDRSTDEVFELAVAAAKRLKLEIVHQEAPDLGAGRPGLIEIADRTLILGLYDDVAIRVAGTGQHARVDVRSASRYGSHDLGRNADRVRVILKEIVTVMESTVPAARGETEEEAKAVKEERPRSRRSKNCRRR